MQLRHGLNSAADIIALRKRIALPTSGYIHLLHGRRILYFFSQYYSTYQASNAGVLLVTGL